MTGLSRKEKLRHFKEVFTEPEDQELFATNEEELRKANDLINLSESPGGRRLIKDLKDEIKFNLDKLFKHRNGANLSRLESSFNLLTKITNAKNQVEAINQWVDSLEE